MKQCIQKKGSELTDAERELINYNRSCEFGSQPLESTDEYLSHNFFLGYANDQLVSFGRLKYIDVARGSQQHSILAIATIVSIEKGKGYGRLIMEAMHNFIGQDGRTAIGFCDPMYSGFYQKVGFTIVQQGSQQFHYIDSEGAEQPLKYPNNDVLLLNGRDNLGQYIVDGAEVTLPVQQW